MRRTIGVFVNRYDLLQQEFCGGVTCAARQLNADVLVFASFARSDSDNEYEILEANTTHIAPLESFDGVIVLRDMFQRPMHARDLEETIARRLPKGAPVVSVGRHMDGAYTVATDETSTMRDIILHVVNHHRARHVCFMGGTVDNPDSVNRLNCFRETMEACGLPVTDRQVYHGDFWTGRGDAAVDWFFGGDQMPDAIVCANDYMAISVCNTLQARGLRVPEDVIVTGYDDISEARSYSPSLSTVRAGFDERGRMAVEIIDRHWRGETLPPVTLIAPRTILRESCGCMKAATQDVLAMKKEVFERYNELENTHVWQMYFSINLSGARSPDHMSDAIVIALKNYRIFEEVYLYLFSTDPDHIEDASYTDRPQRNKCLWMAFRNGKPVDVSAMTYSERVGPLDEVLPRDAPRDGKQVYYFKLLHDRDTCFGYIAMRMRKDQQFDFSFQTFAVELTTALNDYITRKCLQKAMLRNEELSMVDPLTGLLNRRGFERRYREWLEAAPHEGERICLMTFDLDALKRINDSHGHAEGDFAIQTIARALHAAFDCRGFASRAGGDEFLALVPLTEQDTPEALADSFRAALDRLNARSGKPYTATASIGWTEALLSQNIPLEELMRRSDEQLYLAKAKLMRRRRDDR